MPFVSYVLAEELHGSGVLAVLTTALFLAEYASDADDVMTRLAGHTFWDIVDTLVTGVAFGLIGLELHNAIRTASGRWSELLGWAAGGRAVVILVRLLWLLPATWLTQRLHARRDHGRGDPDELAGDRRHVVGRDARRGLGRAGPRHPARDGGREPFPDRDEIIFIAFAVIMATLRAPGAHAALAGAAARGAGGLRARSRTSRRTSRSARPRRRGAG